MTSSVDLGDDLERYVASLVRSGRYRSRAEVLREGVKLLGEFEAERSSLEQALERGLADADAGRVTPIDTAADRLITRYELLAKARAD